MYKIQQLYMEVECQLSAIAALLYVVLPGAYELREAALIKS